MEPDTVMDEAFGPRRRAPSEALFESTRYREVTTLGRGGMGEVVAARDELMGRDVAIKRLRAPAPTAHQVERFLREARIQGALDHPAIPPVHELARDAEGQPYFVMKKLVGTTLSTILLDIARGVPGVAQEYPRERLLRAFAEVCLAVEFAHIRGVIHRDLKPSNIMLGDFGEVFVLDWGVAKVVDTPDPELSVLREVRLTVGMTRDGTVVGTAGYMAPEQAHAQALDGRADVYALGCILLEILDAHRALPPELAALVASATAPIREQRLASARELAAGVTAYLDGDRDLALRRRLAGEHLDRARLAADDRAAMQEAVRALALDPTLPGAAELVGRMMLEPPDDVPPEVEAMLVAADRDIAAKQSRIGVFAYLGYATVLPYLMWLGVHSNAYLVALAALVAFNVALAWSATKHRLDVRGLSLRATLVIAGNAGLIMLLGRMFTPFLVAPGVASVTAAILLANPAFRSRGGVAAILVAFGVALLGPWFAELGGVLSQTMQFDPDSVRLLPTVVEPNQLAVAVGLTIWAPAIVLITTFLTLKRVRVEQAALRRIHHHAWRLGQLVPR